MSRVGTLPKDAGISDFSLPMPPVLLGRPYWLDWLLSRWYPKLIYWLIAWSVIISYSRIYIGVHYPTDLIAGWIVGTLISVPLYLTFRQVVRMRTVKKEPT
ncbi:MAG: phosphatase PAP2 family protein [Saprospirales bacterium]|nr:MAG: phosphatase PAP2 family protein [Saprospirales bacterium]